MSDSSSDHGSAVDQRGETQRTKADSQAVPAIDPASRSEATILWTAGKATQQYEWTAIDQRDLPVDFGDYRLIRIIGEGGMGVVFEAEQKSLGNRRVALKTIKYAGTVSDHALRRFQNEVRAIAQLEHRHIVPVHQLGEENGVHFFVMKLIEGSNLRQVIRTLQSATERRPNSTRRQIRTEPAGDVQEKQDESTRPNARSGGDTVATREVIENFSAVGSPRHREYLANIVRIGIQASNALHHVHEQGIIHRDIKPANLLVDSEGNVWLSDFGLAVIRDNPSLTAPGDLVGTYPYMSPEQAMGSKRVIVDHRTDIYSLGVTLYELLTLERAYPGDSREEILRCIQFDHPLPIRRVAPHIPLDLETIVMKAMSKDPNARFQSGAEVANELKRFQSGLPLTIRRPSMVERFGYWARANRRAVASLAAVFAVTFIAALLVAVVSLRAHASTKRALASEREQKERVAKLHTRSDGLRLAKSSESELDHDPTRALVLATEGARRFPGLDTNAAVLNALDQLHEYRILTGHGGAVGHLAFNSRGDRLISSSVRSRFSRGPDAASVWDVSTGELVGELQGERTITSTAFSPDNFRILTASSPVAKRATDDIEGMRITQPPALWDSRQFNHLLTFENAFLFEAHSAVFDPAGRRAVLPSIGHSATIYDCLTGDPVLSLQGHERRVVYAAFSPAGDRIVTVSDDNTVRVWKSDSGVLDHQMDLWKNRNPTAASCLIQSVAFHPSGQLMVTGSDSFGTHVWDLSTGKRVDQSYLDGNVARFWPNGSQLLTFHDRGGDVSIRDTADGRLIRRLDPERQRVRQVVVSPDSRRVATQGSPDMSEVFLWNTSQERVVAALRGHRLGVNDMVFSPDSEIIATASTDGTVRLWHVASGQERATLPATPFSQTPVAIPSPDGTQIALRGMEPQMVGRLFHSMRPEQAIEIRGRLWMPQYASSRFLASRNDRLSVHSIIDGSEQAVISETRGRVIEAAINHEGNRVAAFAGNGAVTLWYPDEDRRLSLPIGATTVFSLQFSPRGRYLAAACADGFARLWNADDGALLWSLQNDGKVLDVVFSPDGQYLAAVTDQNRAVVWNLLTQKSKTVQHRDARFDRLEFSADGQWMLTGRTTQSERVQLWNRESAELEAQLEARGTTHLAMHPTANEALITSSETGAVIWQFDERTERQITDQASTCGGYSADGSTVFIGSSTPFPAQLYQPPASDSFSPSVLHACDRDALNQRKVLTLPAGQIEHLFVTHGGRIILNTVERFGIDHFDMTTRRRVNRFAGSRGPISSALFTPDSRHLVAASWDQTVKLWDVNQGKRARTLTGVRGPIYCLAVSHDGEVVAGGGADGNCVLWDTDSGAVLKEIDFGESLIWHLAFHPQATQLLAITGDQRLHCYDLNSEGMLEHEVVATRVSWAEYSPDGARLLAIPHSASAQRQMARLEGTGDDPIDHHVLVESLEDHQLTVIENDGPVLTSHFHPGGDQLVTATTSGVTIRQIEPGGAKREYLNPQFRVLAGVLDASGELLAIVGRSQVTLWRTGQPQPWMTLPTARRFGESMLGYSPFIPNQNLVILPRHDTGEFRVWPTNPIDVAVSKAARDLSEAERLRFLLPPSTTN